MALYNNILAINAFVQVSLKKLHSSCLIPCFILLRTPFLIIRIISMVMWRITLIC